MWYYAWYATVPWGSLSSPRSFKEQYPVRHLEVYLIATVPWGQLSSPRSFNGTIPCQTSRIMSDMQLYHGGGFQANGPYPVRHLESCLIARGESTACIHRVITCYFVAVVRSASSPKDECATTSTLMGTAAGRRSIAVCPHREWRDRLDGKHPH